MVAERLCGLVVVIENGTGGAIGPGTGEEAQRLATEAQRAGVPMTMTSTGQVDPPMMNSCPTFSGRDTEWSEWSFIFESVAAMANLEPAMEGSLGWQRNRLQSSLLRWSSVRNSCTVSW